MYFRSKLPFSIDLSFIFILSASVNNQEALELWWIKTEHFTYFGRGPKAIWNFPPVFGSSSVWEHVKLTDDVKQSKETGQDDDNNQTTALANERKKTDTTGSYNYSPKVKYFFYDQNMITITDHDKSIARGRVKLWLRSSVFSEVAKIDLFIDFVFQTQIMWRYRGGLNFVVLRCVYENVQIWKRIFLWVLSHDMYWQNKFQKRRR